MLQIFLRIICDKKSTYTKENMERGENGKKLYRKKKLEAYVNFLFVKKMASVSPYNYISENPFSSHSFPAIIYFFLTVFRCFLSFSFSFMYNMSKTEALFFLPPPPQRPYIFTPYTQAAVCSYFT